MKGQSRAVILTAFLFIFGMFLASNSTKAAVSGSLDPARIQQIKSRFPHGAYWNHLCTDVSTTRSESYHNSVTNNVCTHTEKVGLYDCNHFDGGGQCAGFARKLSYEYYGVRVSTKARIKDLNMLKPGDIVRYHPGSSDHSIWVTAIDGDNVTFADCNFIGKCKIRWEGKTTISEIRKSFLYIEPGNGGSINPNPDPQPGGETSIWDMKVLSADDNSIRISFHTTNAHFVRIETTSVATGEHVRKDFSGDCGTIDYTFSKSGMSANAGDTFTMYVYSYLSNQGGGETLHKVTYNANSGFVKLPVTGRQPVSYVDAVVGGKGNIYVTGWSYDPDDLKRNVEIHIYVGGPAGTQGAEFHKIVANIDRQDIGAALGCGNNHGLEATLKTNKVGNQKVYMYAIDDSSNRGNPCICITDVFIGEAGNRTLPDGRYILSLNCNDKYAVGVNGDSKESGANIQLAGNSGKTAVQFDVKFLGDGTYSIKNVNSQMFLDVSFNGSTPGTNVMQCKWNGGNNQRWCIKESGDGISYNIIASNNNLALDLQNISVQNGTNIQIYTQNNSNAQKWKFEPILTGKRIIADGEYRINQLNVDFGLSKDGNKKDSNVVLRNNAGNINSMYVVTYLNNGAYKIADKETGLCLDVFLNNRYNNAQLKLCTWNGGSTQQWIIEKAGAGGGYTIRSRSSNMVIENKGGNIKENNGIVQCYPKNNSAQKWYFYGSGKKDSGDIKISDVKVTHENADGYTVSCKVTSDCNIYRVQFPTWTLNKGQDDIAEDWQINPSVSGTKKGDTYSFYVDKKVHNNEDGPYRTHIYAFDSDGSELTVSLPEDIVLSVLPCKHTNTRLFNEKEAKCYCEGYTGDLHCADCGELIKKGTPIEKTEHGKGQPVRENIVEATYDSEGSYDNIIYCTEKLCRQVISTEHVIVPKLTVNEDETVIYVKDVNAMKGAEVTVPVCIKSNVGIAGFVYDIGYDENLLSLISVKKGDLLSEGQFSVTDNVVGWYGARNVSSDGVLFELKFRVNKTVENGDIAVNIMLHGEKKNLVDENGDYVEARHINGKISLNSGIPGDMNLDQDITIGDVVILNRYVLGLIELSSEQMLLGDLNNDGDITIGDVVILNRRMLEADETVRSSDNNLLKMVNVHFMSLLGLDDRCVTVKCDDVELTPGESTKIPVRIMNNTGIAGFALEIKMPDYIKLNNIAAGDILKTGQFSVNRNICTWYALDNINDDGVLLLLDVSADDEFEGSDITVSLKDSKQNNMTDIEGISVPAVIKSGKISVRGTGLPTLEPTAKPTEAPTAKPTEAPTTKPTEAPTAKPMETPVAKPMEAPTTKPVEAPITKPTEVQTAKPTEAPTANPANDTIKTNSTNKQHDKLSGVIGLTGKSQKKSIKIKWKKVLNAKGYQIRYSSSKKLKKETQLLVSDNKVTLKKLKPGKTYYIRVRAYSLDGSKKVYGKFSKVIKKKCKK